MTKTYVIKEVDCVSTEEIDFRLYNDLFGEKQVHEIYEEGHPSDYIIEKDNSDMYPMSIEYLESIIVKLKAKGANYVAIDYNCDHPDYTFSGYSVGEATKEDIQERDNKVKLKQEQNAKRQELLKQLKELER
jgi:hypothetical protein